MSSWPWATAWAWLGVLINQVLKNQDSSVYFFILMTKNSFSQNRFCTLPYFETGGIVACSRLSDSGEVWKSGEDRKVKGAQKRGVGGKKRKRKGERPTPLTPVSSWFFCVRTFLILRTRLSQSLEQVRGIGTKRWPIQENFFTLQVWGCWQLVEISTLNWWIPVDHQRYELI